MYASSALRAQHALLVLANATITGEVSAMVVVQICRRTTTIVEDVATRYILSEPIGLELLM